MTFDESAVVYNSNKPLSDEIQDAAQEVPEAVGYNRDEDVFLTGEVLDIRFVEDECASKMFGPCDHCDDYPDDSVIRIDYCTWAVPKQFDALSPDNVIYRKEHVFIRTGVVLMGETFTYGLGPELNFIEWVPDDLNEGSPDEVSLPSEAMDYLVDHIRSEHGDEIEEWTEGYEKNIPEGLSPPMLALYREIIADTYCEDDDDRELDDDE